MSIIIKKGIPMNTKVLLAAIIGFILGALLVSVAATTFEKDRLQQERQDNSHSSPKQ
jgi:hypothetical protein